MTTAYGSITVSGLTDIADIYFEYALAIDSANVTNSYPFNQTGELGWTVNGESRKIPPTWESGYKVWVREVKVKTDIVTKIYGNPYPDTAINQTNVDLAALQTKVKKIWSNSSGSYMASGIGNNDVDTATVSTYGFNSRTTTGGISFNYNAIPLTELGTSGLKLYIPTISNNTVTSSNLGVELTTSALKFYDPTYHKAAMVLTGSSLTFNKPNTTTSAATLNSTGLNITEGSITLGSNFVVNSSGSLTAKSGTIGGITIGSTYLTTNSSRTTYNATTAGLTITTSGIGAGNGSANTFKVDASTGALTAGNATLTGGSIAGWSFNTTSLYKNSATPGASTSAMIVSTGTSSSNSIGGSTGSNSWMLSAGTGFGVTTAGKLYATGANINGAITASSLTISSGASVTDNTGLISNDAIEIGGRNLLRGSMAIGDSTNEIYGWQSNGMGTPEIQTYENKETIHLEADVTTKYVPSIVSAQKILLEYGSIEYIISCDVMFDKEITVGSSTPIHYHNGTTSNTDVFNTTGNNNGNGFTFLSISPASGTVIPANTWQHYEQHIVTKAAATDGSLYPTYRAFIYGSVRTTSESVTCNMYMRNWKVERGNKATAWTTAPEDTDVIYITISDSADSIYQIIEDNDTNINNKLNEDIDSVRNDMATKNALLETDSLVKEYLDETGYINMANSELKIGKGNYSVALTPTAMIFYEGTAKVTQIRDSELIIDKTRVSKSMIMGNFIWTINNDGRLILKKYEAEA